MRWIDLHLHTHYSDGTFTPEEVVSRAKALGLCAISITDHDTIAGIAAARAAAGNDLEVISGVELTADFQGRELHILGYLFDESNQAMNSFMEQARQRRVDRIQGMIKRLSGMGVQVSLEEVMACADKSDSVARPHLAEALVKNKAVRSIDEAFERYIGDFAPAFVHEACMSVSQAAHLIRQAGGVPVLAHPHRMVDDEWFSTLAREGIRGIEVYHSDHRPTVTQRYAQIAERLNLCMTGGSDCHGFRKAKGPLIGCVKVPEALLIALKAAA